MKDAIRVTEITDHGDGSATVQFEMSMDALKVFAEIGLLHVFEKEARRILDGRTDTEGNSDEETGDRRGEPVPPEFPGF